LRIISLNHTEVIEHGSVPPYLFDKGTSPISLTFEPLLPSPFTSRRGLLWPAHSFHSQALWEERIRFKMFRREAQEIFPFHRCAPGFSLV